MNGLRARRWILAALAIALVALIVIVAPKYNQAQTAANADAFRDVVGEARGRFAVAAMIDNAFAIAYALVAVALAPPTRLGRIAAGLLMAGAAADLVENSILLYGVASYDDLTDSTVDLMRTFGTLKWIGVISGAVLLIAAIVIDRRDRAGAAT